MHKLYSSSTSLSSSLACGIAIHTFISVPLLLGGSSWILRPWMQFISAPILLVGMAWVFRPGKRVGVRCRRISIPPHISKSTSQVSHFWTMKQSHTRSYAAWFVSTFWTASYCSHTITRHFKVISLIPIHDKPFKFLDTWLGNYGDASYLYTVLFNSAPYGCLITRLHNRMLVLQLDIRLHNRLPGYHNLVSCPPRARLPARTRLTITCKANYYTFIRGGGSNQKVERPN